MNISDILSAAAGKFAKSVREMVGGKGREVPRSPGEGSGPLVEPEPVTEEKPAGKEKMEAPEIRLSISRGRSHLAEYRLKKARILIGLSREVMDREGRIIRMNDVAFIDDAGEEINATVSFTHARIWFDFDKHRFFIMDEGSRYGTWIEREGVTIEVPAGDPAGTCLKPGDEIFCGQARIHFIGI